MTWLRQVLRATKSEQNLEFARRRFELRQKYPCTNCLIRDILHDVLFHENSRPVWLPCIDTTFLLVEALYCILLSISHDLLAQANSVHRYKQMQHLGSLYDIYLHHTGWGGNGVTNANTEKIGILHKSANKRVLPPCNHQLTVNRLSFYDFFLSFPW